MAESRSSNGLGIVSLVFGILALLICWVPFVGILAAPLSVLGIFLGVIGLIVGIVVGKWEVGTSIAGFILSSLALFFCLCMTFATGVALTEIDKAINEASQQQEESQAELEEKDENMEQDQ